MAKNLILWVVIAVVLLSVFNNFSTQSSTQRLSYSDFIQSVENSQVDRVTIDGISAVGYMKTGETFETVLPSVTDIDLLPILLKSGVNIEGRQPEKQSLWMQLLVACFPILLIVGIFVFFMRQMQGGGGGKGGPMTFGKSKARLLGEDQIKTTFNDVAGCDEAKEEVQELVEFLKDPSKFQRLGGKIPRGVLMVGSPGTGKTLLAKAIAGEAKVPFFTISGSDFVEMFVGVGASRVRDMFEQAKKQAPCIVFIDEIDAVGRSRGSGMGGGHDEREQTLNQLLVEMDGFEPNDGVIVIAATNRPDVLDAALLRPGRFDRQVTVMPPDIRGREQVLKVHMRKVPLSDDVETSIIARGTPGFTGADLANLVNEAALFAARASKRFVEMRDFELAKDRILMGAERKTMVMSEEEKRNTAYHEAGHTIVGMIVPEHDPIYKVTIIPRGRALGVTMALPEADRYSHSKRLLESKIAMMFGGRIAEELILGLEGVTTGASNDIQRASELARNMVTKWGLSTRMGPLSYEEEEGEIFLGRPSTQGSRISSETAKNIDSEVRAIIDRCYGNAEQLLKDNIDILHAMADALMKFETLDADQIKDLMARKPPRPPKDWHDSDSGNATPVEKTEVKKDEGTDDKGADGKGSDVKGTIGGPANTH
ncbi:MAG: ATP-dependent metalloprotease [Moraxellaceae bacterium]|nr:MAG: ATP-dependent metalloprotease [Moraxellaceae bacterium]